MSGMDMLDMLPSDKERVMASLREEVTYWKMRSEILENTCRGLGRLVSPDVVKSVSERVCADMTCKETKESQDKVEDPEESSPVDALANTAVADTEDYKLIAEKALAENGVLREEIERLHETLRFIQVLRRPDSQSKTHKVTGSIQ